MLTIDILTLFPEMFKDPFDYGLVQRAIENKIAEINLHDYRRNTDDAYHQVDDYRYGGGAGMLLKIEPISRTLDSLLATYSGMQKPKVILLSPQGETFRQKKAQHLSTERHLILICGHYKGFDERVRTKYNPDEISIGDYVVSGGEYAAMVITDAIIRLLPGAVGNVDSVETDSFQEQLLEAPNYTRPQVFEKMPVPEVLLSGDHARIKKWRRKISIEKTLQMRPDLLDKKELSNKDKALLDDSNI